jgi:hypothetical protein
MQEKAAAQTSYSRRKTEQAQSQIRAVATVALLAIGLGFIMQALVLITKSQAGANIPGATIFADTAQSVTWSVFVCTGVAIAVSIGKARKVLAGLIGFLFAPLSVAMAKASQRAMLTLLDALEQPALVPLATVGLVRALEYGMLAWLLTLLAEREIKRPWPYIWVGTSIGLVFGIALTLLAHSATLAKGLDPNIAQLAGTLVNEVGSPIGCAVLIYIGQLVSHNFTLYKRHAPKPAT